ncbi:hypothetical protein CPB83DRAFT_909050 [Crepidotus variabilis]|uniref:Uncharacterized protein n=1 Tax=Crepidotus variabilis TaxID=179855 RepID=A0A9P6EA49_9AGAR|nr:hypothetical protein CPB83DRAFT_909050 [Crepidotus variabilis]
MSLTRVLAALFALSIFGVVSSAYTGATSTSGLDEFTGIEFHHAPSPRSVYPGISNAERLKRGLPLKPPKRRASHVIHAPRPSATPVRGRVQAFDAYTGAPIGFISKNPSSAGVAGLTPVFDDAMVFQYDKSTSAPYDFTMVNPASYFAQFPLLGNVLGPSSISQTLGPGLYNYCFFAGTNETPADSPPVVQGTSFSTTLGAETAVWKKTDSGDISLQWVNPDGSKPETFVMYAPSANSLAITGDVAAYLDTFGTGRFPITLKWVDA